MILRRVMQIMITGTALIMLLCASSSASEQQPTVNEIARIVTCPSCNGSIQSDPSPTARRMRVYIRDKVAEGWSRRQILDGLVDEYGGDRSIILASHDAGRRSWLSWGVPAGTMLMLVAAGSVTIRRWRRSALRHESSSSQS